MADQNTRVERERIGARLDEDITGLESRDERDRVGPLRIQTVPRHGHG